MKRWGPRSLRQRRLQFSEGQLALEHRNIRAAPGLRLQSRYATGQAANNCLRRRASGRRGKGRVEGLMSISRLIFWIGGKHVPGPYFDAGRNARVAKNCEAENQALSSP